MGLVKASKFKKPKKQRITLKTEAPGNKRATLKLEAPRNKRSTSILEASRMFLINSTIHGFPRVLFTNKCFNRIFWIILSLISTGLCICTVSTNISNFYKFDVISKTQVVESSMTVFPSITVSFEKNQEA